jgi:hypothetical protein
MAEFARGSGSLLRPSGATSSSGSARILAGIDIRAASSCGNESGGYSEGGITGGRGAAPAGLDQFHLMRVAAA